MSKIKDDIVKLPKAVYKHLLNLLSKSEKEMEEKMRERSIYYNIPHKDIDEFVKKDLSKYDQNNPAPKSLTVIDEQDGYKIFRHYELGCIVGYILWGYFPKNENEFISASISEIEEDDENWFAPNIPIYMAASWMNNSRKTLDRMYKWYHEHIDEGFGDGGWYSKFLKEIVPEEIFEENGMSSCEVLAAPDNE